MKNKGLIALFTVLCLAFLSIENCAAQSDFLLKAGSTFAFGDDNIHWGGAGGGIEKQISRRWTFSVTLEYLKSNLSTSTVFKNTIQNNYYSHTFNESVLTINPEFRRYRRHNILSLREGYFSGVGIEIGQLASTRYSFQDIYVGNTRFLTLQATTRQKGLLLMTHWTLGIVIHLKEELSLELSGGLTAGKVSKDNIIGLIPFVAKVRYGFSKKGLKH